MSKHLISIGVGALLSLSPVLAFAQAAAASNTNPLVSDLEQLVADLTQELNALIASHINSAISIPTNSSTTSPINNITVATSGAINKSQIYSNAEYGFEMQVPNDLAITVHPTPVQMQGNNPYILGTFDNMKGFFPLVTFSKGDSNNIFASISVSIGTTSAALHDCLNQPSESDYLSYSRTSNAIINGVTFATFDGALDIGKAGLSGASFGARYYRTIDYNICYALEVQDSGGGFSSAPGVDQSTAEAEATEFGMPFDAWSTFRELDAAAHTFRFIPQGNTV